jgi:hypothetical protein
LNHYSRDKRNNKTKTTVAALKKELNALKSDFDKQIAAARQEIYVLHRIIEAKDKKIKRMEVSGGCQKSASPVAVISSKKNK